MKKLKKCLIVLCVVYAAAYMLNHIVTSGIENYRIKNAYEKNKIESYKEAKHYDYSNH